MAHVLQLVCVVLVITTAHACLNSGKVEIPTPTEKFPRMTQMDSEGNYWLFWTANATHAVFEVHVRTQGWVGFGLSKNGGMKDADVMIGWVKDGATYITDRYSDAYYEPRLDRSQDWVKLLGKEDDFGTVLKFARKLDTCDEQDLKIESGTMNVIYSYHPEDPEMMTGLCYHGYQRRGNKKLYLTDVTPMSVDAIPSDVKTFDLLNTNTNLPATETYYHCITHRFPKVPSKNHIILFEPVLDKIEVVHHMVLYSCFEDPGDLYVGRQYSCHGDDITIPGSVRRCSNIFMAWAVGGGPVYLPEHVGIPFGDNDIPNFFILETHYSNPGKQLGIFDSSGLRVSYTPTLRQHDASILTVGNLVWPLMVIPPYFPDFVNYGHCSPVCTQEAFSKLDDKEIRIFGAVLHTHLLGRAIITRHVRQGVELPPIAQDLSYDFNFQEFRLLSEEVVVKAGDSISTVCHYDSTGRTTNTYGGAKTDDEMCLSFLLYYPRSPLGRCQSLPDVYSAFNIPRDGDNSFRNARNFLTSQDWTQQATRDLYQSGINTANHTMSCAPRTPAAEAQSYFLGVQPPITSPYQPPPGPTCSPKPGQETVREK